MDYNKVDLIAERQGWINIRKSVFSKKKTFFTLRDILNGVFVFPILYFGSCFVNIYHLSLVKPDKIPTYSVYFLFTQLFSYLCKCFSVFWSPTSQLLKLFIANIFPYTGPILDLACLTGDMDEDLAYSIVPFLLELWFIDRFLQ